LIQDLFRVDLGSIWGGFYGLLRVGLGLFMLGLSSFGLVEGCFRVCDSLGFLYFRVSLWHG
jgi:hypothetical protein